ncbi:MAG: magnesium/cobalt efflux protein [Rhodospirillaceae bacterium]|nr:magnesium/cobalt efflux protein [Rhodospirillaceae bacterium]
MSDSPSDRPVRSSETDQDLPLLRTIGNWLRELTGGRNDGDLQQAFETLVHGEGEDARPISEDERTMLANLLKFGSLTIYDVMVPRADVAAVDENTPVADVARLMAEEGHSRLPVYRDSLDDVIGMVHIKDLVRFWGTESPVTLTGLTRQLLYIPPSMPVRDLLLKMRNTKVHMAMVVDEYGGIDGLVTIEDLVEQIVGKIEDEHDREESPMLRDRPDGSIDADARTPIATLEERVGVDLLPDETDEEVDTLGGLIFNLAGRVPEPGETIEHPSGLAFEVVRADPRRIKAVRVLPAGDGSAEETAETAAP